MVGIRLVNRVAVPLENEDGKSSQAATGVTMMTLSGQSDDSTRLGFNVAWVPTSCIHAERSDDGSLRTWIDMFSPAVRGAFANIGMHYQPDATYSCGALPPTSPKREQRSS